MARHVTLTVAAVQALARKGIRVDASQIRRVSKAAASLPVGLSARERGYLDLEDALEFQIKTAGLPVPEREYAFARPRKWRFDFAWPAVMVAVEVQGGSAMVGRHQRKVGFRADCLKFSTAAAMGWRVLPLDTELVRSGSGLPLLGRALERGPLR